jgi:hypothetical protein
MKVEPSGDMRVMAATMMQSYEAFRGVGFTDEQAFQMTRDILITSLRNNGDDK